MMKKIKFLSDSNCDIPLDTAKELGIELIPFTITLNGKEYKEGYSFTPPEYYKILESSEEIPQTSQIDPVTFFEKFLEVYQEGYDIAILTTMTSYGSGTYRNGLIAKDLFFERYPDAKEKFTIYIFDSKNYSISYGYGVMRGAKLYKDGATLPEILSSMNEWFDALETYFTVFTLKYICRSGRISHAAKVAGELVGIRPMIRNVNGVFTNMKQVRGNRAAVRAIADAFRERMAEDTDYVILRGESDVEAKRLAALTEEISGKPPVGIFYAGATLSTNIGHKATGIGFMAKGK